MEFSIPFAKTVTHQIFVIYLDHVKLKGFKLMCRCYALNWPWELFFHKNAVKGKTHTPNITYDINSKSWEDSVLKYEV